MCGLLNMAAALTISRDVENVAAWVEKQDTQFSESRRGRSGGSGDSRRNISRGARSSSSNNNNNSSNSSAIDGTANECEGGRGQGEVGARAARLPPRPTAKPPAQPAAHQSTATQMARAYAAVRTNNFSGLFVT